MFCLLAWKSSNVRHFFCLYLRVIRSANKTFGRRQISILWIASIFICVLVDFVLSSFLFASFVYYLVACLFCFVFVLVCLLLFLSFLCFCCCCSSSSCNAHYCSGIPYTCITFCNIINKVAYVFVNECSFRDFSVFFEILAYFFYCKNIFILPHLLNFPLYIFITGSFLNSTDFTFFDKTLIT